MPLQDLVTMALMGTVPTMLILLFVMALVAVGRMSRVHRRRGYAVSAGALGALMVAGLASAYWFWGVGFDYVDSYRTPPAYADRVMVTSFWAAVAAYLGVLATGVLAHRGHRRQAGASLRVVLLGCSDGPARRSASSRM